MAAVAICSDFEDEKNPLANAGAAGDVSLIPGSGRSLGVENGNPL